MKTEEELIWESYNKEKRAKWYDADGKLVYPSVLSLRELQDFVNARSGTFTILKTGEKYRLPIKPDGGKIPKSMFRHMITDDDD